MPRLIVKQKAEVINELILKGSQVSFKIGSEPDNDLVIDDKKVSMLHAKIERHANTYHLEDLKSAFGTFLNSEKVDGKVELKNGDEISLGAYTIVFDNPLEYLDMPRGGGKSGQAGAIRLGIARALLRVAAEHRDPLKSSGYLTRDSRKIERKKYGRKGARARFQFSKR